MTGKNKIVNSDYTDGFFDGEKAERKKWETQINKIIKNTEPQREFSRKQLCWSKKQVMEWKIVNLADNNQLILMRLHDKINALLDLKSKVK